MKLLQQINETAITLNEFREAHAHLVSVLNEEILLEADMEILAEQGDIEWEPPTKKHVITKTPGEERGKATRPGAGPSVQPKNGDRAAIRVNGKRTTSIVHPAEKGFVQFEVMVDGNRYISKPVPVASMKHVETTKETGKNTFVSAANLTSKDFKRKLS